jgi:glycosyltransferase involved in cell wall biosynthesis
LTAPPVSTFTTDRSPVHPPSTPHRLRVLHVGKYYPPVPGGMERVLQLLCEHERQSVDSRVLVASTDRTTTREVRNGVPVTRAASLAMVGSVGLSPALPVELRRTPADVTVLHEPNPMALLADFVTRRQGPLVVYFHSEVVRAEWKYRLVYRPLLRRVLDRASRIIVASPAMATSATQLADHREKCVVIPYGIDISRFALTPAVATRVTELRGDARVPFFLFVGRLVPYKGVDVLVRALAGVPAARLVIAGDGPLAGDLQQLARAVGVADRVQFAGTVPDEDLVALYHACDAFVLPSVTRAEAFGMVQIEAMACGKPVVSTNLPSGVPWVNQHDQSGLVVPPGDVPGLAAALTALALDPALRRRLGDGATRRVEREFSAGRMAERTVALYGQVVHECGIVPGSSR